MEKRLNNSSSNPPQWLNLQLIVTALETVQDLIVISLCIGLFCFMVLELREMFFSLLPPLNFKHVTADILFLLVLVELFRLLIIYLQEQRVSIGVAVEVCIVSVLREVIVRGVFGDSLGSNIINRRILAGFGSVVGTPSLVAANLRGN